MQFKKRAISMNAHLRCNYCNILPQVRIRGTPVGRFCRRPSMSRVDEALVRGGDSALSTFCRDGAGIRSIPLPSAEPKKAPLRCIPPLVRDVVATVRAL